MTDPQQVVGDTGQAEAGAGALVALVADEVRGDVRADEALDVGFEREDRRQRSQRRAIGQVAQIESIGAGIEEALGDAAAAGSDAALGASPDALTN